MVRSLVLGGNGFIGSNLVRYLNELGHEVIVLHRSGANVDNLRGLKYFSIDGDLTDIANLSAVLTEAMTDCEAVYNLAACGTSLPEHNQLRELINVEAAGIVARTARQLQIPALVHISSSAAVGFPYNGEVADEDFPFNAPENHYSVTKLRGEREVFKEVDNGLHAVVAIPCSTVGAHGMKPHQYSLFSNIARGSSKIYPPGGLCLTNVNDLVRGIVLCGQKGRSGRRYILGGNNIVYKQYFAEIAEATGGEAPIIRLPKTLLPLMGFGVEVVSKLLRRQSTIDRHVGKMICHNLFYSSGRAINELGYSITDWRLTIHDTVRELQVKGVL